MNKKIFVYLSSNQQDTFEKLSKVWCCILLLWHGIADVEAPEPG